MIPKILAIVDVETTGLSSTRDRIIEIAIIRVENGKHKETFTTLLNPEMSIPPEIEMLTGIRAHELTKAPRFFDIKESIQRLLTDAVFVAHNARFDYSFIRQEFLRLGYPFKAKEFCTARLFRALHPESRHNLDTLIETFGISVLARHRAYDDAHALHQFLRIAKKKYPKKILEAAIDHAMRRPALPGAIDTNTIDMLPETPGVYLFYGEHETPLYIGKSTNIRGRVLSHFYDTLSSPKEQKLRDQVRRIETQETGGELSALLLESSLIKKYKPLYNRMLRYSFKLVGLTTIQKAGEYMRVETETIATLDPLKIHTYIGIFRSKNQAKAFLETLAKKHHLCPKLLDLEPGRGACFWYGLGWCNGACTGKESIAKYNMRAATAFSRYRYKTWPFPGAIMIHESSGSKDEAIIVDSWCVQGTATWDNEENLSTEKSDYTFDIDAYKILIKFLFNPKNHSRIRHIT